MSTDPPLRHRWFRFSLRMLFVVVTVVAAVFLWLLFELGRAPYFPPYDMHSLLGTEKRAIPELMVLVALLWAIFVVGCFLSCKITIRDILGLMLLLAILLAVATPIIKNPPWPIAVEDDP